jgi:hypothetical protein
VSGSWIYDERTGMYWQLAELPKLTEEQKARMFDPMANARYVKALYDSRALRPWVGTRYLPGGYGQRVSDGWELYRDGHTWRYRPIPPYTRRWWRMVGARMKREFVAAWREATRGT